MSNHDQAEIIPERLCPESWACPGFTGLEQKGLSLVRSAGERKVEKGFERVGGGQVHGASGAKGHRPSMKVRRHGGPYTVMLVRPERRGHHGVQVRDETLPMRRYGDVPNASTCAEATVESFHVQERVELWNVTHEMNRYLLSRAEGQGLELWLLVKRDGDYIAASRGAARLAKHNDIRTTYPWPS